jgi:hypothetical protein
MGKWRYGSTILNFGYSIQVSGQLHASAALTPGEYRTVSII